MSLTLYTADGQLIEAEDGPPWQFTPEGFNTFLAANSVPLSVWDGSGASYAGLYKSQLWVAVVINKLTRQISRLPLKVYEAGSQPNEKRRVKQGPLFDAIDQPAKRKGPIDLKQWMAFPMLLHGNAGVRKVRPRPGAPPVGFEPRDWRNLEPRDLDGDGVIDYWLDLRNSERKVIQAEDLIHLSWLAPDGELGISPLQQLGITLRIERSAQSYQESMLRNSVRPSGAVKMPQGVVLDEQTRGEIRADLNRIYSGPFNAGRPVLLPAGLEWTPMSHSAVEAELVDQRKLNREEVAAVYDLPPPMIGILDQATYSNISEQHKMLFTTVLGPWLVMIEERFKAQVIDTEPGFEGQWVEFDLREVLRGDPVKEAAALRQQIQIGLLTINEGRAILNLPPIDHPDADKPMIPTNNVSFLGEEIADAVVERQQQLGRLIETAVTTRSQSDPEFATAVAVAAAHNGHNHEEPDPE